MDGEPDRELIARLVTLLGDDPFHVHVSRAFSLGDAARADAALAEHHLGKLALLSRRKVEP